MSESNHNFILFHNYSECKQLYEVIEGSQLTEASWNLCQENSIPIFLTEESREGGKTRQEDKKKGSIWGAEQDFWRESFLYSVL